MEKRYLLHPRIAAVSFTLRNLKEDLEDLGSRFDGAAATVRGTIWTVADRCDGALTTVKRGRVAVRDLRRRRTIVLKAGKRYLARAPGT